MLPNLPDIHCVCAVHFFYQFIYLITDEISTNLRKYSKIKWFERFAQKLRSLCFVHTSNSTASTYRMADMSKQWRNGKKRSKLSKSSEHLTVQQRKRHPLMKRSEHEHEFKSSIKMCNSTKQSMFTWFYNFKQKFISFSYQRQKKLRFPPFVAAWG